MQNRTVRISKFLSLVLRHKPDQIGLRLDKQGWVSVSDLLEACDSHGFPLSIAELEAVVATSDKKRFALSQDGKFIRANQGHSVDVELGYEPVEPPEVLYHGTARQSLDSIMREGLVKGMRHHVHLSREIETAIRVGQRHGAAIVLKIESGKMHGDGHTFYLSENGVWLTERVPVEYLGVLERWLSNEVKSPRS